MTGICWWIADRLSRALDPAEREAVCGDLVESGDSAARAFGGVLGLVVRRQASLWRNWRAWAALGVAAPFGCALGFVSNITAAITATPIWMYLANWTPTYIANRGTRHELVTEGGEILRQYLILTCLAWAAGFILPWISRRTVAVNGSLFCLAVVCAGNFLKLWDAASPIFSHAFYSLILPLTLQLTAVLLPAVCGMRQGVRET